MVGRYEGDNISRTRPHDHSAGIGQSASHVFGLGSEFKPFGYYLRATPYLQWHIKTGRFHQARPSGAGCGARHLHGSPPPADPERPTPYTPNTTLIPNS